MYKRQAAEAAGIPQEGLGSLPSENTRNKFIEALGGQGVISDKLMNTILGLPYNQAAGIGGGTTVAVQTKNVKYDELAELLNGYTVTPVSYTHLDVYKRQLYIQIHLHLQLFRLPIHKNRLDYYRLTKVMVPDFDEHYIV